MKKTYIYSLLAALLLAVVAFFFFFPDDMQGNVLQQHDTMQGIANGQEGKAFTAATGETTRWTNSLFSGMPNFQISPSYPANKALSWIGRAFQLWLPAPANLLFAMMLGFFIMGLCYKLKWPIALFAAVAWGFSSYFIIIIGAGHIWKFITLAYIPPTIGGIMLCYRGKYIPGIALTALFGALQLQSNHPQMTYYFCFVIAFMVVAWLCTSIRKRMMKRWCIATLCCAAAAAIALGANSPSLYNSAEYAKETVRGRATDLKLEGAGDDTGGMDRGAITAWSYGLDETFSLLIPNVKGGASVKPVGGESYRLTLNDTDKADELYVMPEIKQLLNQFPQYFGDQPGTNGPVYVGAFVLMLAILALFVVPGPMKWALFAVSLLAILLSWGHNFPAFTDLFIDNFPGYNKFRAVSSILVIVEFTVPLLAAMCIRKMIETPDFFKENKWTFYTVMGGGAFICLIGWAVPSVFGQPFSQSEIDQFTSMGVFNNPQYAPLWDSVRQIRMSLVSADSLRSLIFILLGAGVTMMGFKGVIPNNTVFVCCLTVVALIDLYPLNKRYVNSENFTEPMPMEQAFKMTEADKAILKDTTYYRVYDAAHPMEARSSYFHKTIGGYHAAKLTRYNDLLNHQILQGNMQVINMLNGKYILREDHYQINEDALGNAWMVDSIFYVADANAEMSALDTINPGRYAVADKIFEPVLGKANKVVPGDTIYETSYAPNRLTYKAVSAKGNLAVFSEIFFPWGWEATIDGKPAQIGRVDYTLRAMQIPAGTHDIVMTFDPKSSHVTTQVATASVIAIYALCALALVFWVIRIFADASPKKKEDSGKR